MQPSAQRKHGPVFVGRQEEQQIFAQALAGLAQPGSPYRVRAVIVSALSGFGKSSLLARFEEIAAAHGAHWVNIDAKQPRFEAEIASLPALLREIQRTYLSTNHGRLADPEAFHTFERQSEAYGKLRPKQNPAISQELRSAQSDPSDSRADFASWLGGDLIGPSQGARQQGVFEPVMSIATPLRKLFGRDKTFVDEHILADSLARGLRLACGSAPLVVILDAYERLLAFDSAIQRSFLARLEDPVLIVLSGQVMDLERRLHVVDRAEMRTLPLKPLSRAEARAYLHQVAQVQSEALIETIVSATQGVPAALSLSVPILAESRSEEAAARVFQTPRAGRPLDRAIVTLVPAWLNALPETQRHLVEAGCVLRRFDRSGLGALLGPDQVGDLASLLEYYFIRRHSDDTWSVHEAIRNFTRRHMTLNDPGRFRALNGRAVAYFQSSALRDIGDTARFKDQSWLRASVELLYHLAQVERPRALEELLRQASDAHWYYELDAALQLIDALVEVDGTLSDHPWLAELRAGVLAEQSGERQRALEIYAGLVRAEIGSGQAVLHLYAHDVLATLYRAEHEREREREHLLVVAEGFSREKSLFKLATTEQQVAECARTLGQPDEERLWLTRAAEHFHQAAQEDPYKRPKGLASEAYCRGRLGQKVGAELAFQALLKDMPASLDDQNWLLYWWTLYLQEQQRSAEAITAWRQQAERQPGERAWILERVGDLYRDDLRDLPRALEAYEASHAADPGRSSPLWGIANAYVAFERWPEAVQAYERIAATAVEDRSFAQEHIGNLYRDRLKALPRALEAYEASHAADPGRSSPLWGIANAYIAFERWPEAVQAYERIAATAVEDRSFAQEHIGNLYRDQLKALPKALEAYEASHAADPGRSSPLWGVANAYVAFERWPEAVQAYERLAADFPADRLNALSEAALYSGRAGQAAQAELRFKELISEAPDHPFLLNRWALFLNNQERWAEALAIWNRLLELAPDQRAIVWEAVGDLQRDQAKDLPKALEAYEQSYLADPGRSSPLYGAARAYLQFERWADTAAAFRRIAAAFPAERLQALSDLALSESRSGQVEQAEARFKELLAEDPERLAVLNRWALFLGEQQRPEEAIAVWTALAHRWPAYRAPSLREAGHLYLRQLRDLPRALDAYEASLAAEPANLSPLLNIAQAYEAFERWPEAIATYERVIEGSEQLRAQAREAIGDLYARRLGDLPRALEAYEASYSDDPSRASPLWEIANAYRAFERWPEAVHAYRRIADRVPDGRALAWEHIGDLYRDALRDLPAALTAYETSFEADRSRASPLFGIVNAFRAYERWPEAAGACERIAAAFPEERVRALANAALDQMRAGDVAAAEARLTALRAETPDHPDVSECWAIFLAHQGRHEEAAAAWARLAEYSSAHRSLAWEHAGNLYRDRLKDLPRAVAAYEQSHAADPARLQPLIELARAYEAFEQWEQVHAVAERIVAADPGRRLVLLASAALGLDRAGRSADAEGLFARLLAEAPDDRQLQQKWMLFLGDHGRWAEAADVYARQRNLPAPPSPDDVLRLGDRIVLEVGNDLIPYFDPTAGSPILQRLGELREGWLSERGFILPFIRIMDSRLLRANEYVLTVHGQEVLRGEIHGPAGVEGGEELVLPFQARATREPGYQAAVIWAPERFQAWFKAMGHTLIPAADLIFRNVEAVLVREQGRMYRHPWPGEGQKG